MSSRNSTATPNIRLRGTRLWTGGITLVSSGHREFDKLLGSNGQPLGTAMLIEEDRFSCGDLGSTLARYWMAEALACGQTLLLPSTKPNYPTSTLCNENEDIFTPFGSSPSDLEQYIERLPKNMHLEKFRTKRQRQQLQLQQMQQRQSALSSLDEAQQGMGMVILEEEEDEEEKEDDTAEEELKIAWQYKRSIQDQRRGRQRNASSSKVGALPSQQPNQVIEQADEVYCHSYDLMGRMQDQYRSRLLSNSANPAGIDLDLSSDSKEEYPDRAFTATIIDCYIPSTISSAAIANSNLNNKNLCSTPTNVAQNRVGGYLLHHKTMLHIRSILSSQPPTNQAVIRVALINPIPAYCIIALPLLLATIRSNSLPVVILVTTKPWCFIQPPNVTCGTTPSHSLKELFQLRRVCDAVLSTHGFDGIRQSPPSEFRDLVGILRIRKLSLCSINHYGDTKSMRPLSLKFGFKRDARKLGIQMLHLPPEENSPSGSGTQGNGGSTAAPLDF
mmetsp:Transcript_14561/g.16793  ORF Transcript_14561/g.16793 Transcript_14561/m.16793 type:complete len:502 (-) Transcript_14561:197-1702(-)|eukprot:CAMPEP_0194385772 /NCGR_PEP_ID=MMETSP0174-20130528/82422_1 /TAXON_ID=216777 /ORGANISM="Proboscia alata, Strain PI-D3" /LENGTH=501 /DNA_ID=CAMNT_0039174253 /DNA_START=168 /DNA_END=1673 /DNA_ORIENTATION=+